MPLIFLGLIGLVLAGKFELAHLMFQTTPFPEGIFDIIAVGVQEAVLGAQVTLPRSDASSPRHCNEPRVQQMDLWQTMGIQQMMAFLWLLLKPSSKRV